MKTIIYILFFFLNVSTFYSQSGWQILHGGTTDTYFPYYNTIRFIDNQYGWLCGNGFTKRTTNGGTTWDLTDTIGSKVCYFLNSSTGWVWEQNRLYRTTNSGISWLLLNSSNISANAIYFLDDQKGFLCSAAGLVRRTTNSGVTWDSIYTGVADDLKAIHFTTLNNGYTAGDWGTILSTSNGGLNWSRYGDPNLGFFLDIEFINQQTGFVCGTGGSIIRTTNGGISWQPFYASSGTQFVSINFSAAGTGYLFSINGEVLRSTNMGISWSVIPPGISGKVYSASVTPSGNIWVVSDTGRVSRSVNSGSSWETILSQFFTLYNLNSVHFINPLTGWTCGNEHSLYKTINGGLNWTSVNTGDTGASNYKSVIFLNSSTGFTGGGYNNYNGILLRTINGGANWQAVYTDSFQVNSIFFLNSITGWAAGNSGIVLKTTNSGLNWSVTRPATNNLTSIHFVNANTGYLAGLGMWRSTDGGASWNSEAGMPGLSISFPNAQTGYVITVSQYSTLFKTTNFGINWGFQNAGTGSSNSIQFITSEKGWIAGVNIKFTSNGGTNWIVQPVKGLTTRINAVHFINENEGWAVGNSGTVLKTNTGGIGITQISSQIPREFRLFQNYPNPFNPVTKIRFSVPNGLKSGEPVTLKIYDILGRLVSTLLDQNLKPGLYEADWDASEYSSGVYFCSMYTSNFIETKKMIVLK